MRHNEKLDGILDSILGYTIVILLILLTITLIIFICLFGFYWIWFPWDPILFVKFLFSAILAFLLIALLCKIGEMIDIL